MKHKVIIIGGGAAGIMAAVQLKNKGIDTAIVEGNDRIAKKLLTTGNGRCNISNKYIEQSRYHSENPDFFAPSLSNFSINDTIDFFSSIGLHLVTLEDGKMFPMSLQASSVIDILRLTLEDRNIPIYLNSKVKKITALEKYFKIETKNEETFEAEKVILCCGGKSAPNTGSDGLGYSLAKSLGHSIVSPIPSLVQLKLDYKNLKALAGVKFIGIAEIYVNGELKRKEFGEILFTDYGISGPPILQLSRYASYYLSNGNSIEVKVDIMYTMDMDALIDFLESHFAVFNYRSIYDSLIGIINKKMIPIILKEAGIYDIHKPCSGLEYKEKQKLYSLLKGWKFKVYDTNSFLNAQVTAGGINTKEINSLTMESLIVPKLYFAGEILDVDGDCGGFNLQWAWSSAYTAANGIAHSLSD
ncbi:NAD(P)/FAD-dependent oxidoreductase [Candidatus Clostridium stratigraminis]|uniref:NAD(P)/FAD-dependent oxidoreductase n=1 Tax=Candidatus Clostridium stratigraminis TaxID=3381661 RepID=A0ABW8T6I6_9CLOT